MAIATNKSTLRPSGSPTGESPLAAETAATALPNLKIGNLTIGFPVVQAALSGYSDWPMRMLAREHGASYTLCEVMLDEFLVTFKDRSKNRHFLYNSPEEQPVAGQLMGAEPDRKSVV